MNCSSSPQNHAQYSSATPWCTTAVKDCPSNRAAAAPTSPNANSQGSLNSEGSFCSRFYEYPPRNWAVEGFMRPDVGLERVMGERHLGLFHRMKLSLEVRWGQPLSQNHLSCRAQPQTTPSRPGVQLPSTKTFHVESHSPLSRIAMKPGSSVLVRNECWSRLIAVSMVLRMSATPSVVKFPKACQSVQQEGRMRRVSRRRRGWNILSMI